MKLAVITDVHANLPALDAALEAIAQLGCDRIVHTGDVVDIGPHPRACLERLLSLSNIELLMGNHDAYMVFGTPAHTSPGEREHQQWTRSQLSESHLEVIARWPYALVETIGGVRVRFQHYGLDATSRDFAPIVRTPTADDLERLFPYDGASLTFYGHHHPQADAQGSSRFVNPGSLGCFREAVARFCVVNFLGDGRYELEHHAVPYDDGSLLDDFERLNVPDRELIVAAFFGGRNALHSSD
jgi:protein phosphatase